MKTLLILFIAITLLAAGVLILIGETSQEPWATYATINAGPSVTVYAGDPDLPRQ